jgi:hypothetical protein
MIAHTAGLSDQIIGRTGSPGSRMPIHEIPTAGPD